MLIYSLRKLSVSFLYYSIELTLTLLLLLSSNIQCLDVFGYRLIYPRFKRLERLIEEGLRYIVVQFPS